MLDLECITMDFHDDVGTGQIKIYVVRQESNETGAIYFFYLTFTYKSTLPPSK